MLKDFPPPITGADVEAILIAAEERAALVERLIPANATPAWRDYFRAELTRLGPGLSHPGSVLSDAARL
jgi:hypothetical protein